VRFNSLDFAVFLPIIFIAYWAIRRRSAQNALLLVASYVFYGWWDWRFLGLIFASSLVDFTIGLALAKERRRSLLILSLVFNLGLLGFFKYFGFFIDSAASLLEAIGMRTNRHTLQIILPVGISFYTFQTLSYTIDVYRGRIQATRDWVSFFTFVSFFPQLVAGPIERARDLLPQFGVARRFEDAGARDGLRQILWGLFKKIVIADTLAPLVDEIFANYGSQDGVTLTLGLLFFALQIYGDFSGYSDIAIGSARLFGFRLTRNFAFPYFSRNVAEFWSRWHISLSNWFRDYLYFPLGGSRGSTATTMRNVLITFTVSGLWHGADWNYAIWGLLNGLYFLPLMLRGKHKLRVNDPSRLRDLPSIGLTLTVTLLTWTFFRADSAAHAVGYLVRGIENPLDGTIWHGQYLQPIALGAAFIVFVWFLRNRQHGLDIAHWPKPTRWISYAVVSFSIALLGNFGGSDFIYFQF
jgi:alginate O-acetyltransferase complex protein AlgI